LLPAGASSEDGSWPAGRGGGPTSSHRCSGGDRTTTQRHPSTLALGRGPSGDQTPAPGAGPLTSGSRFPGSAHGRRACAGPGAFLPAPIASRSWGRHARGLRPGSCAGRSVLVDEPSWASQRDVLHDGDGSGAAEWAESAVLLRCGQSDRYLDIGNPTHVQAFAICTDNFPDFGGWDSATVVVIFGSRYDLVGDWSWGRLT